MGKIKWTHFGKEFTKFGKDITVFSHVTVTEVNKSFKRFEIDARRVGKSIEVETKRVSEKINCEIKRCTKIIALSIEFKVNKKIVAQVDGAAVAIDSSNVLHELPSPVESVIPEEIIVNPERLRPGRAFIINHLTFNDASLNRRTGSEEDSKRLQRLFRLFGLNVQLVHNGTLANVRHVMEEISSFNFKNLSCLVLVIMSHGYEGNIIAAKDGEYSLDHDIMYPILQNKSLTSKLKLVVTQACKGPVNPLFEIEGPRRRPTAIPSEILQVNSCVEGYVSYLDPMRGSPFIISFCKLLEQYGHEKDIFDLAKAVVADVKEKYSDIQIPMVHSNLTKEFVFGHYINERNECPDDD